MSSERRIDQGDYWLIHATLTSMVDKLKRSKRKSMYKHMDVGSAMSALYDLKHVYIVGTYLVAYEIGRPWYTAEGTQWLNELLVLQLAVSGASDFSVVPAFLERKAREAGCSLAVVGTALAKADSALASLYSRHGFRPEAVSLTKEP